MCKLVFFPGSFSWRNKPGGGRGGEGEGKGEGKGEGRGRRGGGEEGFKAIFFHVSYFIYT